MAEIVLDTERLLLRRIEEGDAELQYRYLNSPAIMEHLGGVQELANIQAKHDKTMEYFSRHGFGFMFLIEKGSNELVGHAGLKRVDNTHARNQGDFEIGWLVREDRWRRGYAFEAVTAVIDWAFATHNAPHVVALTSERNTPSWRLMDKLGMERRRDLDFDDPAFPAADNPTIIYSLSRDHWKSEL
ncbi:MAG: GNAT family N-acetyltransferase [Pseudomonadota bacterium]